MKLIVGLGNPGAAYEATRHNIGYDAVLLLAHRLGRSHFRPVRHGLAVTVDGGDLVRAARDALSERLRGTGDRAEAGRSVPDPGAGLLLLPTTYMNLSGVAVRRHLPQGALAPEDVVVVHDDLDLPGGRLKIRVGGSSGGHRGVESILAELGWAGFVRVKVGIGRPPEGTDPVEFVTQRPAGNEVRILEQAAAVAAEAALVSAVYGPHLAMNIYNRRAEEPEDRDSRTAAVSGPGDGGGPAR